jgi:hypothetical protein
VVKAAMVHIAVRALLFRSVTTAMESSGGQCRRACQLGQSNNKGISVVVGWLRVCFIPSWAGEAKERMGCGTGLDDHWFHSIVGR